MSGSERLDSKADPLGHLSQAYFGGLDMMVKGCEPALKGVARWNLELMGFVARRARAWLETPGQLGACKSPVEVFKLQTKFLQAASADYADAARRLTAAWGSCTAMPRRDSSKEPRDYITFPEPQESPSPKRGERKAA
ncbi:MAG: phasin family protein [Hyphomicrobiaceae bacterium]|nr:phasin family protein [Hyphomicrobiaceae bacterium]